MPESDVYDDKAWVDRLRSGDGEAFQELYYRYAPRLFTAAFRLLKSETAARDVLQDVFLKVWEVKGSLDPEKSFRAFLFRITENKVYDFFRAASRDQKMKDRLGAAFAESGRTPEDHTHVRENNRLLQEAIDRLPERRRHVYIRCKLEGKSYEEVSKEFGISTSTVSDHIVKATHSIKEYLQNRPGGLTAGVLLWLVLHRV